MKVLVIGSGGREHALVWKLKQSPRIKQLYCAPGNGGTDGIAVNVDIAATNVGALALWAIEQNIDLTVVGPEAPLAEGIVDIFSQHGLLIFGPSKAATRLESSKIFSKEIMLKSGVRTAPGEIFSDFNLAKDYVTKIKSPVVIKADGLAGGKGVVLPGNATEAVSTLEDFMLRERFGAAGKQVIVEKRLVGKEASVICLVDGETVIPFVVSQDYKRIWDGDKGLNTGGMGAISPTPVLGDKSVGQLVGNLFIPVLSELLGRGIRYRGFLYAGVMVEPDGAVNVLEFNCRLGDPETEVLLPRMKTDLLDVIEAAMHGSLASCELRWKNEAAATVVLASAGYPEKLDDGKVISGIGEDSADSIVFHAGTKITNTGDRQIVSNGGRVLAVTGLGQSVEEAVSKAYSRIDNIKFDGMQFRKDIGMLR